MLWGAEVGYISKVEQARLLGIEQYMYVYVGK